MSDDTLLTALDAVRLYQRETGDHTPNVRGYNSWRDYRHPMAPAIEDIHAQIGSMCRAVELLEIEESARHHIALA